MVGRDEVCAETLICISQATPEMGLWKICSSIQVLSEPEGRYGDYSLGLFRSGNTVLGPPNDGEFPRLFFLQKQTTNAYFAKIFAFYISFI